MINVKDIHNILTKLSGIYINHRYKNRIYMFNIEFPKYIKFLKFIIKRKNCIIFSIFILLN